MTKNSASNSYAQDINFSKSSDGLQDYSNYDGKPRKKRLTQLPKLSNYLQYQSAP